uniref:Uncharacterized protein n=1 Tax=Cucumis sativus TaxID=3659 RepID=A0A0A0L3A2_CUCSA
MANPLCQSNTTPRSFGEVDEQQVDEGEKQGSSSCVEVFEAAIDELHSPALSDEDTCIEGFEGERGKVVNLLKNQAVKVVLSRVMH